MVRMEQTQRDWGCARRQCLPIVCQAWLPSLLQQEKILRKAEHSCTWGHFLVIYLEENNCDTFMAGETLFFKATIIFSLI